MKDMINHPPHYTQGKIEVIDAIEDWKLDYHEGNVVKYIARAKHKGDELENLKKAQWYLNRLIEKKEADNRAVLDSIYGKGVIVQNYSDLPKDYKKPEYKDPECSKNRSRTERFEKPVR